MPDYIVTERTIVTADSEGEAIEKVVGCVDGEVLEQSAVPTHPRLQKTTIVIWSEPDAMPAHAMDIDTLAQEAMDGAAYCSKQKTEMIEDPADDPDWDDTEFFLDTREDS